ncbi:MAG: hypothetical protein ABH810_00545 [bacterium]
MKNKKMVIFFAITIIIIIITLIYFALRPKSEPPVIPEKDLTSEEIGVKSQADTFTNTWGNFTDNASQGYLESIKPFLSETAYEEQAEVAESQKYFNEQSGEPLAQKYTIKKVELIERSTEDSEVLTYKITAVREFADQTQDSTTYIKYQKIEGNWKIISIESD